MHPVDALGRLGGMARWPALSALGVGRSTLLDACRLGAVLRPGRGVFCLPGAVDEPTVRALVARGQLSCAHAARAHGLEVFSLPTQVHVRIPRSSRRTARVAGTLVHRWGQRASSDLTPLATTLRDCAHCLPRPDAVAVLDSAVRSGRISMADIALLARSWGAGARRVVELMDPQSQSVLESVGRTLLVDAAIGEVESQKYVRQVGWVDLVVDGWLVVELDGWATHKAAFQEDRRRDAELSRLGFVVLRFTYADLARRQQWFVEVVSETVARGRPPWWIGALGGHGDDFATRLSDTPPWRSG
jgi:very-short-patch-repair endonuclease